MNDTIDTRAQILGRKHLYGAGGSRVRLVRWAKSDYIDDNRTVPPGTEGTVQSVDDAGTVFVLWDNRVRLGVCLRDELEQV